MKRSLLLVILWARSSASFLVSVRPNKKLFVAKSKKKNEVEEIEEYNFDAPNVDAMRARAGVLRSSILQQQMELQKLERQILCCSQSSSLQEDASIFSKMLLYTRKTFSTFSASSNVLVRKLGRVNSKAARNEQWGGSISDYVVTQTATGARIVGNLVKTPDQLLQLVDPDTPSLVPHLPAIYARLDKLESHVAPILERVLNNRRHLASIEPYLDEIMERFDDIEPHLPWILDNIDILAPYTGLLLQHIDELLLYGASDGDDGNYDLAEQLMPFLEYYVSRLDIVGPHLPLLRPHVPKLLKHNRVANITPHIDRLFARGYTDLSASANLDILLFWFGWTMRIPGLPKLFFSLPGSPRIVSFLARRLPKRFARGRGYCSGVSCYADGDYGTDWNKLTKKKRS